jgi:phasin
MIKLLQTGDVTMADQPFKLKVPAQIKEATENAIEQAERGFSAFMDAINKSVSVLPNPTTEVTLKALSITEQNMKAAFDHAKKIINAKDVQEAMRFQAEFMKGQYEAVAEQLKQMGRSDRSSGMDSSEKSIEIK